MKKLTASILSIIFILILIACSGGIKESPASDFEYKYVAELNGIEITQYIGNKYWRFGVRRLQRINEC